MWKLREETPRGSVAVWWTDLDRQADRQAEKCLIMGVVVLLLQSGIGRVLFLDFEPRQEKNTSTDREWSRQETSLGSPGGVALSFNFKNGSRRGLVSQSA